MSKRLASILTCATVVLLAVGRLPADGPQSQAVQSAPAEQPAATQPTTSQPAQSTQPAREYRFEFRALPGRIIKGETLVLEAKALTPGDYEFRWLVKYLGEDWDWSATWVSNPRFVCSPRRPGVYAFQVDIRRREDGQIVKQRWLGETAVIEQAFVAMTPAPPSAASDSAIREGFEFPQLPREMNQGGMVLLQVRPLSAGDYEFRWWSKYGPTDWALASAWVADPVLAFSPEYAGEYNLQVDIRRRSDEEILQKKWLGTIPVSGPLVGALFYSPAATAVPVGTPIRFFVRLKQFAAEDLEFRLWELGPAEKVVYNWQAWPLPPYIPATAQSAALQIDVRLKHYPAILDKRWLNSFTFSEDNPASGANLLRNLVSDDFDVFDLVGAREILARELGLACQLLLWEYQSLSVERQLELLAHLDQVEDARPGPPGQVQVRLAGGRIYELDLKERTLRQRQSPVTLRLALADYPKYRAVFDLLKDQPDQARLAGALTFAVYEGYHYGTPPQFDLMDISDTVSHCGSQCAQLHGVLRQNGIDAEYVLLAGPGSIHAPPVHLLVQARLAEGSPLILDPSTGYIYVFCSDWLGQRPIPEPLVLPQCRSLVEQDLRNAYSEQCHVTVFRDSVPSVVPLSAPRVRSPATTSSPP